MKPQRIVIIRHGESQGNVDRRIHGATPDWKIPLTEKGKVQARKAGKAFFKNLNSHNLAVYVSPYYRARQTWEEMRKYSNHTQLSIKEDPRLREQEWGNLCAFEDRKWADIEAERDAYGTFFYRFLHGESGADVYDRCTTLLDTLYRDFEKTSFPSTVLIVTHGFTMRVLIMRWLHYTVEQFHDIHNPPNCASVELLLGADDKYHLNIPLRDWPKAP